MNINQPESGGSPEQEFGQQLGRVNSTSEMVQIGICLSVTLLFGILWLANVASTFVLIIGCLATCGLLHYVTLSLESLRSSITAYENGIELNLRGKTSRFSYDKLECFVIKHTHHYLNGRHMGTKADFEFEIEGMFRSLRCEFEFSRGKQSEEVITLVTDKCGQAVQSRLFAQLQQEGEVSWNPSVSLTADGLKLSDGNNDPRLVRYTEIEDFKMADNELKIWKTGDAMPCLVIANDTPNFVPLFGLFQAIRTCSQYETGNQELPSGAPDTVADRHHPVA